MNANQIINLKAEPAGLKRYRRIYRQLTKKYGHNSKIGCDAYTKLRKLIDAHYHMLAIASGYFNN